MLTEISRYQTRVTDLESALNQQGLVIHTHTCEHTQLVTLELVHSPGETMICLLIGWG